ncbi:MAG: 2-oxoacid:ferredoxin oxidoreductase subunit gamma [Desulfobacterales bacterium]|nr:2-oxoacid:ferredoxin oxidoreductase subunit gamma [Desulfobacterales bacterium]MCP4158620.1 2-oxoacid:ferredoxin oxidoreductase subunit gamma [Deltaproteobacteria bacterium]
MYFDTIIAGFGGQGVMLIGNILAYAGIAEEKNVTYMPVYGVEMRGGTANCTIVVSDDEIGSPIIQNPVSAIIMNVPSLDKFAPRVKDDGFMIINSTLITEEDMKPFNSKTYAMVPSRDIAIESAGNEKLANMVVLGATIKKSGIVQLSSMEKALTAGLDKRYHHLIDANLKALQGGADFV